MLFQLSLFALFTGSHYYSTEHLLHTHYYTYVMNSWLYWVMFFMYPQTRIPFIIYSMFATYHIPEIDTKVACIKLACEMVLYDSWIYNLFTQVYFMYSPTINTFHYTFHYTDSIKFALVLYSIFCLPTVTNRIISPLALTISWLIE